VALLKLLESEVGELIQSKLHAHQNHSATPHQLLNVGPIAEQHAKAEETLLTLYGALRLLCAAMYFTLLSKVCKRLWYSTSEAYFLLYDCVKVLKAPTGSACDHEQAENQHCRMYE